MSDAVATAPTPGHELLLALAGWVDDDLLAIARELVAVGEEAGALELLVATLSAARTVLPHPVRDRLADTAERRLGVDLARLLPPGAPLPDRTPHVFSTDGGEPGVAERIREVVAGLTAVDRSGARTSVTWRLTPAGAAPGPVPHPVVLMVLDGPAPAEVITYQVGAALARAGIAASVEAFVDGAALPPYQRAALAAAGSPVRTPPSPMPVVDRDDVPSGYDAPSWSGPHAAVPSDDGPRPEEWGDGGWSGGSRPITTAAQAGHGRDVPPHEGAPTAPGAPHAAEPSGSRTPWVERGGDVGARSEQNRWRETAQDGDGRGSAEDGATGDPARRAPVVDDARRAQTADDPDAPTIGGVLTGAGRRASVGDDAPRQLAGDDAGSTPTGDGFRGTARPGSVDDASGRAPDRDDPGWTPDGDGSGRAPDGDGSTRTPEVDGHGGTSTDSTPGPATGAGRDTPYVGDDPRQSPSGTNSRGAADAGGPPSTETTGAVAPSVSAWPDALQSRAAPRPPGPVPDGGPRPAPQPDPSIRPEPEQPTSGPAGVDPARFDPARNAVDRTVHGGSGVLGRPESGRTGAPPSNGHSVPTTDVGPDPDPPDGANGHPSPRPAPRPAPRTAASARAADESPVNGHGTAAVASTSDEGSAGEREWERQWGSGSWSMPAAGTPDPDLEPATAPTPTTPPLSRVAPSPTRRTSADGQAAETGEPASDAQPRHRLDTPEASAPGATASGATATGAAAPGSAAFEPGPSGPGAPAEGGEDVLDSRLTPNEQELLRRLQAELAAREGGSGEAPRNGTSYPPAQD